MPDEPKPETRSAIRTLLDGTWDRRDLIAIATLLLAAALAWAEYGGALSSDDAEPEPASEAPASDTDASTD